MLEILPQALYEIALKQKFILSVYPKNDLEEIALGQNRTLSLQFMLSCFDLYFQIINFDLDFQIIHSEIVDIYLCSDNFSNYSGYYTFELKYSNCYLIFCSAKLSS